MAHNHVSHERNHVTQINKAFIVGIILNAVFVLVEIFAGFVFKSMSLLTDAGHNLSDVISLLLAFMAVKLASMKPNQNHACVREASNRPAPSAELPTFRESNTSQKKTRR